MQPTLEKMQIGKQTIWSRTFAKQYNSNQKRSLEPKLSDYFPGPNVKASSYLGQNE